jgi:hypothetical protein
MLAGCLPTLTVAIAFPEEIISQCVRLYFSLTWVSYCDTFGEIIAWPHPRRLV